MTTVHVTFNPAQIDRADLFLKFRRTHNFSLFAFYHKFCFVKFKTTVDAEEAIALYANLIGVTSIHRSKHDYTVPYPQPNDSAAQHAACLHITHLPAEYTQQEMKKILSIFPGFMQAHFYGKYAYIYFVSNHYAARTRQVLRQETNLVVSFAKNPPQMNSPPTIPVFVISDPSVHQHHPSTSASHAPAQNVAGQRGEHSSDNLFMLSPPLAPKKDRDSLYVTTSQQGLTQMASTMPPLSASSLHDLRSGSMKFAGRAVSVSGNQGSPLIASSSSTALPLSRSHQPQSQMHLGHSAALGQLGTSSHSLHPLYHNHSQHPLDAPSSFANSIISPSFSPYFDDNEVPVYQDEVDMFGQSMDSLGNDLGRMDILDNSSALPEARARAPESALIGGMASASLGVPKMAREPSGVDPIGSSIGMPHQHPLLGSSFSRQPSAANVTGGSSSLLQPQPIRSYHRPAPLSASEALLSQSHPHPLQLPESSLTNADSAVSLSHGIPIDSSKKKYSWNPLLYGSLDFGIWENSSR